ncbi:MAG: hypothetical protein HY459_01840 [Parcubacteria group bacterium]|nr:hypothetical protein [Parcubacteria group bacterium]
MEEHQREGKRPFNPLSLVGLYWAIFPKKCRPLFEEMGKELGLNLDEVRRHGEQMKRGMGGRRIRFDYECQLWKVISAVSAKLTPPHLDRVTEILKKVAREMRIDWDVVEVFGAYYEVALLIAATDNPPDRSFEIEWGWIAHVTALDIEKARARSFKLREMAQKPKVVLDALGSVAFNCCINMWGVDEKSVRLALIGLRGMADALGLPPDVVRRTLSEAQTDAQEVMARRPLTFHIKG